MTTSKTPRRSYDDDAQEVPAEGFDVTCVIGRVEFGANGNDTPHVAAYKLIAQHDAEGTFTFPMQNGGTCAVTVEYRDQP